MGVVAEWLVVMARLMATDGRVDGMELPGGRDELVRVQVQLELWLVGEVDRRAEVAGITRAEIVRRMLKVALRSKGPLRVSYSLGEEGWS